MQPESRQLFQVSCTVALGSLGNLSGGLPFSIALDAGGGIIQRKMGRLVLADLALLRGLE